MAERNTISIVLYGNTSSKTSDWLKWYEYAINQINGLGFEPNYIGITGKSFNSGKIAPLNQVDKKLRKSFEDGEIIVSIAVYSLPDDFKQAAFDYNVYLSRTTQGKYPHIVLTISGNAHSKFDTNNIIKMLKEHIEFTSGQMFEMSNYESPQFYAAKVNPPDLYKTLKVTQEIFATT